jgi:hypothetical protein
MLDLVNVPEHAIKAGGHGTQTCPIARVLKARYKTEDVTVSPSSISIKGEVFTPDPDVSSWISRFDSRGLVVPIELAVDHEKQKIRMVVDNDFTIKLSPEESSPEVQVSTQGRRPWWKLWGK